MNRDRSKAPRPLVGSPGHSCRPTRDPSEPTISIELPASMELDDIENDEATAYERATCTDSSDDESNHGDPACDTPVGASPPTTAVVDGALQGVEAKSVTTALGGIAPPSGRTREGPRPTHTPGGRPNAPEPPQARPVLSLLDSLRVRPKAAPRKSVEVRRVEVRKPRPTEWFRAITPERFADVRLMAVELNRSRYVLPERVAGLVPAPTFVVRIVLCVDEHGALFVWLLRTTEYDGERAHEAHIAAEEAALLAEHTWTRLWWCPKRSEYVIEAPEEPFDEPSVDGLNLDDIIDKAIANVLIDSTEHPKIRALRGVR